jgi:EpsD family peptidyl-prolyl cis-trans isomerase
MPHTSVLLPSLGLCLLLSACGGGGAAKGGSQVAVKVNDGEVSVHQLDLAAQPELARAPAERAAEVTRRVLAHQELAAQAARKDGLDSDPRVVQLLEAAKRQVLARAWQDRQTQAANEPSSDQVDKFYADHPELFANRRVYSLQEHSVELPADQVAGLKARLEAATSAAQAGELVRGDGFKVVTRNLNAQAEEIPLVVLRQLAALKPGQSLVIPRTGGLKAMTIVDAVASPVDRQPARRRIVSYLLNERRMEMVAGAMKEMRAKARIEYIGPYASAGSAASAAR